MDLRALAYVKGRMRTRVRALARSAINLYAEGENYQLQLDPNSLRAIGFSIQEGEEKMSCLS